MEEFSRGVSDLRLDEGLDAETAARLEAAWRDGEGSATWAQEFNQVRRIPSSLGTGAGLGNAALLGTFYLV